VSLTELAVEGSASAGFEGAESLLRGFGTRIIRNSQGGRLLREEAAGERLRGAGGRIFQPMPREQASQMFEDLPSVKFDISPVSTYVESLEQSTRAIILNRLKTIEAPPGMAADVGERIAALLGSSSLKAMPIKDLQHLRSQLIKMQSGMKPAIKKGLGVGRNAALAPAAQAQLRKAQRAWFVVKSAEDMDILVDKFTTPIRRGTKLNFAGLNRELDKEFAANRSRRANKVLDALKSVPGAQFRKEKEFDEARKLFRDIELGGPLGFKTRVIVTTFANAMLSPAGRKIIGNAVINGRGKMSLNVLSLALNATRRAIQEETGLTTEEVNSALPGLGDALNQGQRFFRGLAPIPGTSP
jgi:hypothetical protein